MRKKGLALLFFLTIVMGMANAQTRSKVYYRDTLETRVYYSHRSAEIKIVPGFRDNRASLRALTEAIKRSSHSPNQEVVVVKIVGGMSPEKSKDMSMALVKYRVEHLKKWFRDELKDVELSFETTAVGIDWEGLTKLVEDADHMPYKDEVLNILKNTPEVIEDSRNGRMVEVRKRELATFGEGEAWSWMEDNLFEELRACTITVICDIPDQSQDPRTIQAWVGE